MMIFLTIIAFIAVIKCFADGILCRLFYYLAVIQVIFQLYYFMHMNQKGHKIPWFFCIQPYWWHL